jgi:hypothetical protein
MTYVPNTIRIPTHGVDFTCQGLGFWGRTQNCQWSHHKVSRGEGRKREREEEGRGRGAIFLRRLSRAMVVGATHEGVTPTTMV